MSARLYARWMDRWETDLANRDTNRTERPFEWGLEWLEGAAANGSGSSLDAFTGWSAGQIARSHDFFVHPAPGDAHFKAAGSTGGGTVTFTSGVRTPHEENNTVHAEYFPAPEARGRAVLVIPQWNSDFESHLGLCRLLNRFGMSALRLSPAYHHRRMPPELTRADYHVSANLGRTVQATRQSVVDARSCLDWLEGRGYTRLGILGTSLGSCIALLAAAHETRLRAAAFNHVSMNVGDVVWTGMSCRHIRATLDGQVTLEELNRCWSVVSPSAYLELLARRSNQNLLVWAPYDTTFRPEYSRQVLDHFRRLGIPHETVTLPCGHYTTGKFPFNWMDGLALARFLKRNL
ncbi:MAG: alpha/beta hydrolase family protein [Acidobacteriota bacterium]